MSTIKGLSLFLLLLTQTTFTDYFVSAENCFPETDKKIPVFSEHTPLEERTGITEEEFNTVIDEAEAIFGPVIEEKGATLSVNRKWTDDTINASAQQQGSNWIVNMFGGLARHEHATIDSFRAVLCHEIGHHAAGAPKGGGWFSTWASNEGQSDYFATYQCMKKLIIEGQAAGLEVAGADLSIYEEQEVELVNAACGERFSAEGVDNEINKDYIACRRSAFAGLSLGRLLGSLRDADIPISFLTPDETVVDATNNKHPDGQCRADTYLAGALCDLDFNSPLDDNNPDTGTCNRTDGFEHGLRPLCWFKPGQASDGGGDNPFPFPFPFNS